MKKTILVGLVTIFSFGFANAQANKEVLPQKSQDFIKQNFSSASIESAEKENRWFNWDKSEMYEVRLSNGMKLDFNKDGEITEIDSKSKEAIPENSLPDKVQQYLKSNYRDAQILSWEKEDGEQEVELADGTELEFDRNGKFLKQD